ncbi:hypothetical protein KJ996_04430 [Patescibacteria group bacterium]|nr:hypothetical protein [Patescibacteria group bacterium]
MLHPLPVFAYPVIFVCEQSDYCDYCDYNENAEEDAFENVYVDWLVMK